MIFADTNILVYALDDREPVKQEIAQRVLREAEQSRLVISTQVLQELYVAMGRSRISAATAAAAVRAWAAGEVVVVTVEMVVEATVLHQQHKLHFWDAVILQAAISSGCTTLYTEDMQHGREIGGVRIVNPFANEVHEAAVAYAPTPVKRARRPRTAAGRPARKG